jgi:hypothetical protein
LDADDADYLPNDAYPLPVGWARAPRRVKRISDMAGVLREINSIYNAGRRGMIPASDCSKLASVVDIARRSLESGDLEKRLKALEAQLGARQGNDP